MKRPTLTRQHDNTMTVRSGAFELTKKGASRYDLHDPYHIAVALSWPHFALALVAVDLTINVVFALLYLIQPGSIASARPGSFSDAFFFSLETLATVGYGVMAPATLYGHCVSAVEIVTGMAFTAIMTGLLFVRFSRPKAKIIYADNPVVASYNGQPTLMVRIANGRMSVLTDGSARLVVLLLERTTEGQTFRGSHELRLVRPRIPVFALTWTLMHPIDAQSPLAGFDSKGLCGTQARLYLSLDARDIALGAMVHDMHDWSAEDVLFGTRYSDAVSTDEQGRAIADLTRIHLVEPDSGTDSVEGSAGSMLEGAEGVA
jgi:inward rectifier potassium channel